MGRKIFVSYKYNDFYVKELPDYPVTRVRDYVTALQKVLDENDHINKGEADGEDLSDFKDSTIETSLKNKIYDSSLTIVMISSGMNETGRLEEDQWIPWEISYSLREKTRSDRTSSTNAMLAIVLPDIGGFYNYYIEDDYCKSCNCRLLKTNSLFRILNKNMFNKKEKDQADCDSHQDKNPVYLGYPSYIYSVKWCDFILNPNHYLDIAYEIRGNIEDYNLSKSV